MTMQINKPGTNNEARSIKHQTIFQMMQDIVIFNLKARYKKITDPIDVLRWIDDTSAFYK